MQNSTQTSSSFYMHMRQAYAATPPPPAARTSMSEMSSFSYAPPHSQSHVDASFNGSSYLAQPNRYNTMPQDYMFPQQQQQLQYSQQPAIGNGYMGDRRDEVPYDAPSPPSERKRNDPYSISPSSTVDTGIPARAGAEYPVPPTRLGSPSTLDASSEPAGRISHIRQRLAEIQSRGSGSSPQRDANRSPSHPSHHQSRQRSHRHRSSSQGRRHTQRSHSRHHHHRDVSQDSGIVSPSPSSSARSSPARDVERRFSSAPEIELRDDVFTAREMTYFRVIELTAPVLLLAELTPGCGALTELCDSARIKVFPKHVVFVKPDGDPVVELVISELCNLDEDGERQFVDFIVRPKKSDKEQVIRAVCYDTTARGILYKLVSCRRDAIENARSTSTAPQSIPR